MQGRYTKYAARKILVHMRVYVKKAGTSSGLPICPAWQHPSHNSKVPDFAPIVAASKFIR